MKNFEELDAFQHAVDLMVDVYRASAAFPIEERYGLTSQIRRASVSVVSNIAEGQGRLSDGEWRNSLSHARGSLYEVQAQAIAANRLEFLDDDSYRRLRSSIKRAAKPLSGLIAYVKRREASTTDN
ncbi:MAG TPA: four helix bundle protein [Thermoanaerobaculia bacterium]|nr:four helix bundle protein [Thermoanaerobaculia bacterium]